MGCPERRSGMPGSFSTVIAHMEPPSSRKQAKRVRLGPERPLLGPWRSSEGPGEADLIPTTPDWPAWVGFMVTTHFDLVSGPFHSPIFIGLHSVSTSANMYHLHTRAGELPRSASSHFKYVFSWGEKHCPPPNYWGIGPQHRFHCKTTKYGDH